jgi:hypothetical protein
MSSSSTQSTALAFVTALHHHDVSGHGGDGGGFLSLGAFATTGLIVLCVIYILVKKVGRFFFEGTPWYARLALLGTAGYGIYRLLGRGRAQRPPWPTPPWPAPPQQEPWQAEPSQDGRQTPPGRPRRTADS